MHSNRFQRVFGLVIVVLAIGSGGCGARQYDVSGKVMYNGAPLDKPDGQIVFVGAKGEQVMAAIGSDGTYHAPAVLSGQNRVAVYYPNPKAKVREKGGRPKPGETVQIGPTEPPFLTPLKYGAVDTSELSVTVDRDMIYDVNLTGPPIR